VKVLFKILFWFLYFPLMRLLVLFLFWNRKVEERERFEKRNKFEFLAHSFSEKGVAADLCFEFSSEGEFQQVAPLIDDALIQGKKIELVFFSPSVEKAVMKLAQSHPEQVRYLRYPLVRIFPFMGRRSFTHWITAKTLVMVRYDLFPEFLLWSMQEGHQLKLVWMSFKKERSLGKKPSFWKKLFLKHAHSIVYAVKEDEAMGKSLGHAGKVFDFRAEQIRRRMFLKDEKFQKLFPLYPEFKSHLGNFKQSLIVGNAWPSDLKMLATVSTDVLVVVVPHQLSLEILKQCSELLAGQGREVFEIHDLTRELKNTNAILINKKGILCELYGDFPHAYVGGGFETSIHSVLEPLISGSRLISCGPKHFRSTEYDLAREMGQMTEVNSPEKFLEWLNHHDKNPEHGKINSLLEDYEKMREFVISC
jgi:3-deoxy-D-manno-octulosonic-acid transferase